MKASITGLALGAMLVSPAVALAAPAVPSTGTPAAAPSATKHIHRVFDIMRKGSKIGTDTFDITRTADKTDIKIATHITVKIAFITAYRYDHTETGSFKGNQILSFTSTTDDNGTAHQISAAPAGGKITLTVDGAASTAPKGTVPASLFSASMSKQPQIFDPANGKRMAINPQDLGQETVAINGAPQQLDHIKLDGDFPRDLWFDADGLVKMSMLGSDNSEVTSQLRQSTASR